MKKRLKSVLLAVAMLVVMVVPAHAADAVDNLLWTEPSTPAGFSHYASVNRNAEFDLFVTGTSVTLTGLIPHAGVVCAIIGISIGAVELFDDDSLPVRYVDHIYEAEDPEINYGVPYVYWHKLEFSFDLPNGETYSRWTSYYEYAVAPK